MSISLGQWSKIVITNLLKTLQNPEFIQELRWKLEMMKGFKMATETNLESN